MSQMFRWHLSSVNFMQKNKREQNLLLKWLFCPLNMATLGIAGTSPVRAFELRSNYNGVNLSFQIVLFYLIIDI